MEGGKYKKGQEGMELQTRCKGDKDTRNKGKRIKTKTIKIYFDINFTPIQKRVPQKNALNVTLNLNIFSTHVWDFIDK